MTANAFIWRYIAMPHTPQEHAVAMRVAPPPCVALPYPLRLWQCLSAGILACTLQGQLLLLVASDCLFQFHHCAPACMCSMVH